VESTGLLIIGSLSERDWQAVRERLALTFGLAT
jgi:hypothetical protein